MVLTTPAHSSSRMLDCAVYRVSRNGSSIPDVRSRKSNPDAMPALAILSDALRTKYAISPTTAAHTATCQKTSRTRRLLTNARISGIRNQEIRDRHQEVARSHL